MEKEFSKIAEEIGRKQDLETENSEYDFGRADKIRTVREAVSEAHKENIREMFAGGMGVCEIARRTGFAQSSISRWCKNVKKAKEKEPAPAPTKTSSTSEKDKSIHTNDTPILKICQGISENIAKGLLEIYAAMSEAEQKAFDLGEIYRQVIDLQNAAEGKVMEVQA